MESKNDKRSQLEGKGIIFIWGTIYDALAESVCREIIEANMESRVGCIQMLINSGGGSCQAGFSIIDMMEWSRILICTAGFGIVGSMATLIFIAGEKGRRVIKPGTAQGMAGFDIHPDQPAR
ncbi:ATP-dependent Clp protease proteolytic subunit [bacterium]|nr:ATP-dependent Clp protease proteolytic subunit [candidate division CSSED10-310 bacterium]